MASDTVLKAIQSMEFARDLEPQHLEKLTFIATEMTFSKGQTIFHEGDVAEVVYLIQEGRVAVQLDVPSCGPVTTYTVGPGELLGWSSMFPGRRRTAGACAVEPTWAIAINAKQLCEACQADHDLGCPVMWHAAEVISERLGATRQELLHMFAYIFA